jgi:hypothetical protein
MPPTLKKILLISAETLLVLVIIALLAANWIPLMVGTTSWKPATPPSASRER